MAQTINVPIADIDIAGSTQVRVSLSLSTIEDYAQAMADGVALPPVRIARSVEGRLFVIDGFHRIQAAKNLGRSHIDAEINPGDAAAAAWAALAANRAHGVRMSPADKARAIELALSHPESAGMTDHAIAQHLGVSAKTVTAHREKSTLEFQSGQERGVTTDGRRHPRKNTRRRKPGRPKGSKNKKQAAPPPVSSPDPEREPATEPDTPPPDPDTDVIDRAFTSRVTEVRRWFASLGPNQRAFAERALFGRDAA